MSIARSTPGSKLLARLGTGGSAFNAADWTCAAGLSAAVSGGKLVFTNTNDLQCAARYNPIASRGKVFLYVIQESANPALGTWNGPIAHLGTLTEGALTGLMLGSYTDAVQSRAAFFHWLTGTATFGGTGQGEAPPPKLQNAPYALSLFVDSTSYRGCDYSSGLLQEWDKVGGLTTGQVGYSPEATLSSVVDRWSVMIVGPDRAVSVTGVPTGGSAELRKDDDTVLDTDVTLDAGVAVFNMQSSLIPLELCTKLVVKNAGGTILDTYDAGALGEIIEPGETYVYTAVKGRGSSKGARAGGAAARRRRRMSDEWRRG